MAGVYVHIPFCHSKCAYCDFYSTPATALRRRVIDAIAHEYALRKAEIGYDVRTVYFGGGTPSIIEPDSLAVIASAIPLDSVAEFTLEANPEDVTAPRVSAWRSLGVNRVSMGVQSLVDSELKLIGRRHSANQALDAVKAIRDKGIDNISLDLIYGLPGQTLESWRYSLCALLDMHPQHFSAYMLSYEPRTRLTAMLNAGKVTPVDEDTLIRMYDILIDEARARGYEHYEISNFALPGFRAKHNSSYWDSTPYLGLGPAAHSFDGKCRRVNPSDIRAYLEAIEGGSTAYEIERENRAERFNDLVITRLRTSDGLNFAEVPVSRRRQLLCDAYRHILSGAIVIADNHLRIPERSWLVSDDIMSDLLAVTSRP